MKAKLIVVGGDAKAAEVKLKLPTVIGRGREANLTLPHPLVSRKHCEIFEDRGRLCVRDLGSLNGTYVNNERISEATSLPSGDLLTVGAVTFRAVYAEPSLNAAPVDDEGTIRDASNETAFEFADGATEQAPEEEDLFDAVDEVDEIVDEVDGADHEAEGLDADEEELPEFPMEPTAASEEIDAAEEVEAETPQVDPFQDAEETLPAPAAASPATDAAADSAAARAADSEGQVVADQREPQSQEQPVAAAPQPPPSPQPAQAPRAIVPSARPVQPPMARPAPAPTASPVPANESNNSQDSSNKGDDDPLDSFLKGLR
jgi:hypothetical protein